MDLVAVASIGCGKQNRKDYGNVSEVEELMVPGLLAIQDDAKAGGRTPTLHGNCELCLVDNDFHIFTGSLDGIWYTRMTIAAATSLLWDRKACLSLSQIGQSPSGQSWSASDANNRSLQPFDL